MKNSNSYLKEKSRELFSTFLTATCWAVLGATLIAGVVLLSDLFFKGNPVGTIIITLAEIFVILRALWSISEK